MQIQQSPDFFTLTIQNAMIIPYVLNMCLEQKQITAQVLLLPFQHKEVSIDQEAKHIFHKF
jgi:hypothetical protein